MNKLKKTILWIIRSSMILYISGFLVYKISVDEKRVAPKILNYLRGSVRYVQKYTEGERKYDKFRFIDSVEYYERILKYMPFQQLTHGALGYCYYKLDRRSDAIESFESAIDETPSFFGYYYNLGIIFFENGDWEDAIDILERATEMQFDSMLGYYSAVSRKMFSDKVVADAWFGKKALSSKEQYKNALKMIVLSHYSLNDNDNILSVAIKSLKAVDDEDGFFSFYAGQAAYDLGRYKIAYKLFDQCLKVDKDNAKAFEFQGLVLQKIGKNRTAQLFLEKAKKMNEKEYTINKELIYFVPLYEIGG